MVRLLIVHLTVAGLVLCPAVCWVHALDQCAAGECSQSKQTSGVPASTSYAGCDCCRDEAPQDPAGTPPRPGAPCEAPGSSCICKGGTIVLKSDVPPPQTADGPVCWLPATSLAPLVPTAPQRSDRFSHPLATAPPIGRAMRILFQSLLV